MVRAHAKFDFGPLPTQLDSRSVTHERGTSAGRRAASGEPTDARPEAA
jgi:hypothetical protein